MRNHILKMGNSEQGFTLIEVIITSVILGILIGIVSLRFISLANAADTAVCKTNQCTIITAQTQYYVATLELGDGHFAETIDDLLPYIKGNQPPQCPRGGEYILLPHGRVSCTVGDHQ
ncbi:prepilin-type N-terminal cleavage/methylation domain-containing protein [bacterium]|nr:prepilin-type N-terminal cleavage/methylation domain-containing protein [bacterium]